VEIAMTTNTDHEWNARLTGLRVLVVEDDYFIADEICTTLREHGAQVLGPSPDIEHGLNLVRNNDIDCAVLDINLHGNLAYSLASELRQRGTPSIFATGYDGSVLPSEFSGSVRLEKPVDLSALLQAVRAACARPQTPAQDQQS
jgi:DNA-binding response OmpR family regulator